MICYDGIFIRDHWHKLTSQPWYAVYLPDIHAQVQSIKIKKLPQTISALEKFLPEKPQEFDKEKFFF